MDRPLLHERFPALRATLPFRPLGAAPTPVRALAGRDGGELWVKEEGAYGEGPWGGNKVRKLAWLLPELERRGRRSLVTVGGTGTHWGLAAALYGAQAGIDVTLALVEQPVDDHVRAQLARLESSAATLYRAGTTARTAALLPLLLARHGHGLRPAAYLPAGGSSPLGAVAYAEVGLEIGEQVRAGAVPPPAAVVTAVGSGGTAAGLLLGLGLAGLPTRVVAVVVNDRLRLDHTALLRLARRSARLLRARGAPVPDPDPARLEVRTEWLGEGYGAATPEGVAAQEVGRAAGLAMEPVYTAKALAAVRGPAPLALDGPVLFLHTHGPR